MRRRKEEDGGRGGEGRSKEEEGVRTKTCAQSMRGVNKGIHKCAKSMGGAEQVIKHITKTKCWTPEDTISFDFTCSTSLPIPGTHP